MSKARVVIASSGAAGAVRRGHPWIWRDGVARHDQDLASGDVVEVRAQAGEPLGQAIWDQASPIAARMYSRATSPKLDASFLAAAIARAITRRETIARSGETTAYRLCHGEGDRVPGVVIDRYENVAVLRLDGDAVETWLPALAPAIWAQLEPLGIVSLVLRSTHRQSGERVRSLFGAPPPSAVTVRENGIAMFVDVLHGQKTGAFLDQRDNRARVRQLAAGRCVLNLFSYAGGFSTAAALGGASHVTSVDVAHAAHADAQRAMQANGIDPAAHAFVTADAFAFLSTARGKGQTWDLVISDPPSFAPNEKAKPRALAAYRKLHAACAAVLAPGGIFCAASCSSHIGPEDFASTMDDMALARNDLSLVGMFGPPADHPVLAAWPEGRYLKFAILR